MNKNTELLTRIIDELAGLKVMVCDRSDTGFSPATILKSSIETNQAWLLFEDGFVSGQRIDDCEEYKKFPQFENLFHGKVRVSFPELYFCMQDNSVISARSCCWFLHPEDKDKIFKILHEIRNIK